MNRKRDLKLSLKISLTLGSIIFLSIFIYLIIYIHNSQKYENEVMGKENIAMLHSIDSLPMNNFTFRFFQFPDYF